MTDDLQHRRHRLRLDLEADDMPELIRQLEKIAFDIDTTASQQREWTSAGYYSSHYLTLTTDPDMTGDQYRAWLMAKPWRKEATA